MQINDLYNFYQISQRLKCLLYKHLSLSKELPVGKIRYRPFFPVHLIFDEFVDLDG